MSAATVAGGLGTSLLLMVAAEVVDPFARRGSLLPAGSAGQLEHLAFVGSLGWPPLRTRIRGLGVDQLGLRASTS